MKSRWLIPGLLILATTASYLVAAAPTVPAPAKNRSLAINPAAKNEVWVVNEDNDAVTVQHRVTGASLATIAVGTSPRNVAFNSTGSKAYVTNERGNVALDKTFLEYNHSEILGSVSVIDTATRVVINTITAGIGVEPVGIALAPNGKYLLVTNFRSSSLSVIDPTSDTVVASLPFAANLNFLPAGVTLADVDANGDFLADLEGPSGIAIKSTSDRAYITHMKTGYVSVISLALNGSGVPTSLSLAKRINLNKYPFDSFANPVKITEAKSRGTSKFLEDITISPDGTRAWVAHVLHNVNHDVNVPFAAGDFANRVYPAVSILDLTTETFQFGDAAPADASDRLEWSWSVPLLPTGSVNYGVPTGVSSDRRAATVRAITEPVLGTTYTLRIEHGDPFDHAELYIGRAELNSDLPGIGKVLVDNAIQVWSGTLDATGAAQFDLPLVNIPALAGISAYFQGFIGNGTATSPIVLTNGVRTVLGTASGTVPARTIGHRIGHPSRVEFSGSGSRALVLSRGSEDVMMFDLTGPSPRFMQIFPRRDDTPSASQLDKNHTPFAMNRLIGDKPTGMLLTDESPLTEQAKLLVNNEGSRDLSLLVANYATGVLDAPSGSLVKVVAPGADKFTLGARIGGEIFADASRAQTTGNFNNSCESCHFRGGDDGSVWTRGNGPRSTIAMYGGIRRTGALLWKANRLNLGETGPMFGGENGGHGLFTDAEQEGLIEFAEKLPVPLNPNLVNADLSAQAKLGRDLFLGENGTGTNPFLLHANCASCHSTALPTGAPAWFTNDQFKMIDPTQDMAHQDPCLVLKESLLGEAIQDVNSGVNLVDDFGVLIVDRNLDGISDLESYTPMNPDTSGDFTRDDPNSVLCDDPGNPGFPLVFNRAASKFDVPTKMGVLFTGPYFHDHAVMSLRTTVDPALQVFPKLDKLLNTQHDVRGQNVQSFLSSGNIQADLDAILAFIQSL